MASMSFLEFFHKGGKKQTFRPKKKFEPGTLRYSLHKQAIASLGSGINLRDVVKLPPAISPQHLYLQYLPIESRVIAFDPKN
ncbi:unnamed protein product [Medioppia subpectinata]|uniref:Uncharacterized protein n=1 Tax=Medioppia subpectinata TaxID=1979941 RepID=A0A7R9KZ17_9ACAR|nr:unnamed protein product [Medioppia subpectinata]CAG2112163.1 unnamed protein product [Medioppia subpectinata]